MNNKLNELVTAQKVNNDDLTKNEIKSDLNRKYEGDFDDEVEPSHYSFDIWSYCDNPKDLE
jgi:hypothetical protein